MASKLKDNLNSQYFEAANKLTSKKSRRRIVAYVESYDDIFFWRTVLSRFEDETRYFEVMLPSHKKLERGKKSVLMNFINGNGLAAPHSRRENVNDNENENENENGQCSMVNGQCFNGLAAPHSRRENERLGPDMIACVDADYDYLLQGITPQSKKVIESDYVFHTYAYAIENLQCYAPTLHDVCVAVTLNDHRIFDFDDYLRQYSEAIFPLFIWSVWAYRSGKHNRFSLSDFARVVDPGGFNVQDPQPSIDHLRHKVGTKVRQLQAEFPDNKVEYLKTKEIVKQLGVTPTTTYLYIQGHHLFDNVIVPILNKVCNRLRQERQDEIARTARHHTQRTNEMSCYEHSLQDIRQTLKKNMGYIISEPFQPDSQRHPAVSLALTTTTGRRLPET